MPLECTVEQHGEDIVVTPHGAIDLDAAPHLRTALKEAITRLGTGRVDVDMRHVTYLDSSGIGVFVAAQRAAAEKGVPLALRNLGPMVSMVLRLTNLLPALAPEEDAATSSAPPQRST